jgi:hypothetical protein
VRTTRLAGLVAAGALLLVAAAPASAADTAMIRVLHGSPDAPNVDVYADGSKILSDVPFGTLSDYLSVPAKTYAVRVCATGTDGTVDANCPIIADLTFNAGKKYTIAASDLVAQIKANVFVDGGSPVDGKAKVRVVHLSADTPAVDVLTQDGSAKVVENLSYPDATGYLALAPGSYDLKVCAHADNSVCPLDPAALDLASGTAYSVFAIGALQGGDGVNGLTAVVGVDGMAAPATDTVSPTDTSNGTSNGNGLAVLLLGVAAVIGLGASRRLAKARSPR